MAVVGRGFSDSLDSGLGSVTLFFELESTIAAIDGHAEPAEEAHAEQLIVNECHGDACRFGLAYANRLHHGGQARSFAVCRLYVDGFQLICGKSKRRPQGLGKDQG